MKAADFNKITVQSNYKIDPYDEFPPGHQVEERANNKHEKCNGKGKISMLVPVEVE